MTFSRPGTGTYPNARCERKACSPRHVRSSGVRAKPSLPTVQECSARIAASSARMDPVPSTSATDRGDRIKRVSTMVISRKAAACDEGGGVSYKDGAKCQGVSDLRRPTAPAAA